MNIFWLDTDLTKCAQYHCDKHVVKMPTEYAQLLSSAMSYYGYDAPYEDTHVNHPCAKWARESLGNYQRLWDLAEAVSKEYTYRYGRIHKAHQLLLDGSIPRDIDIPETYISPFPNCTAYELYPAMSGVDLYRIFYMTHKGHILKYKNREEPPWMGDRFYQQQYGVTIGCLPAKKGFGLKGQYQGKDLPKPKATKEDLAEELGCLALKKLLVVDLQKLKLSCGTAGAMPEGRLKKPYIDALRSVHDTVDWSKLTVKELKEVIEKFGE